MKNGLNPGFTLAEVLIVIGIIGIVASITIPTLVKDTQQKEFKAAWAAAYSILAQSTLQILNDNGTLDFSTLVTTGNDAGLRDLYKDKLKTLKSCDAAVADGCYSYTSQGPIGRSFYAGDNSAKPALVLNNGMSMWFVDTNSPCQQSALRGCGTIVVDVNGNKKPNLVGVDIFAGVINSKNQFVPMTQSPSTCSPQTDLSASATYQSYNCSYTSLYQ